MKAPTFLVLLDVLLRATPTAAQHVTIDQATGDARIEYVASGASFSVTVPSADRITPVLTLIDAQFLGDTGTFTYRLENKELPPATPGRGILTARVVCPANASELSQGLDQPRGWRLMVYIGENGLAECQFEAGLTGILDPGRTVDSLRIRAVALPGTADVEVLGVSGGGTISSGEDTPDTVYRLMEWAQGRGRSVRSVTPSRSPTSLATTALALNALTSDLALSCDSLDWIAGEGVCRSLRAKVDAARRAIERQQTSTARNQLTAFRAELDAQRGTHVTETAYHLLVALNDRVVALL